MIEKIDDTVTLSNGYKMPGFGFGTYKSTEGDDAERSVLAAIGAGYRHIDCASFYKNEDGVGRGIAAALSEYGLDREDLFITSKVWTSDKSYDRAIESAEQSMLDLGVKYLDLLLIHWPADDHSDPDWKNTNLETWRAFIDLYKDGKVKAIGVSNFWPEHLQALMETEVPPMVNQIEYHPGYMQNGDSTVSNIPNENVSTVSSGESIGGSDASVLEPTVSGYCPIDVPRWCKERDIVVESWSPLGRGKVLENETLIDIAEEYGCTTSQICLRWVIQHGIVPLPKSTHENRIIENANVFDFELDDRDMARIDALPLQGFSTHTPKDVPW